jgi:hypothetical protein
MSGKQHISRPARLPKLCGADIELGGFVLGSRRRGTTCGEAARAVLAEIDGLPRISAHQRSWWGCSSETRRTLTQDSAAGPDAGYHYNPQDWGRKYLAGNGGCVYIDLDHVEVCLPEVRSAFDHVACWHAMLRIVRQAMDEANRRLPDGERIQLLANNSDGQDNSYGSHLNFLLTRREWENIFERRMHHMLYLAAYQASSIIFTGQGKTGSENGAPLVEYQLSQRADFFENLSGVQTTYKRPIVNSRNEALCGPRPFGQTGLDRDMARLHVIFFDNTLCHVASLLKVGVTQIVLAMLESGRVGPDLILDDPLDAVVSWSHDPTLEARAAMASGRQLTALEVQLKLLDRARAFVDSGDCDESVPRAREIFALWEDTLLKLERRDFNALARRLDWVLKLYILDRTMGQRPGLGWDSPQIRHLDLLYSSLDPSEGLYWAYESQGFTEQVVAEAEIERFLREPPEDTRAWTRAMLLRRAADSVESVDWDSIRLMARGRRPWSYSRTVSLPDPLGFTRRDTEALFAGSSTTEEILDALEEEYVEDRGLPETGCAALIPSDTRWIS